MQCKSFVSAVVASALLAGYAWADNEGVSDEKSKRVQLRSVSTATGFNQDIKEAPASISIIPKEEILTRPVRDLGDMVQNVPGVDVTATKTGDTAISMRGLGSDYVLILIDGKRQNVNSGFHSNGFNGFMSAMMPPASMIERIEVLRGPASVVWGSDAMGGVINIITKKNPDKLTANLMLETRIQEHNTNWQSDAGDRKYGSFGNMWGINGYLATPIIKDKLSLSVRGKYQDSGMNAFFIPSSIELTPNGNGVINPYTTHSPTGYSTYTAGARLNWSPSSKNNFYLDGEFMSRVSGSLNTSGNRITSISTNTKANVILNHDGDYDWGKTTTYFQYMNTRRIPHASNVVVGQDSGILNWGSMRENQNYVFDSKLNKIFDFDSAGVLKLNGGVYYMYETYRNYSDTRGTLAQHQAAVYAEGEYTFNQYISTSLGLRYNYSNIYSGTPNPRFYVNINPTSWWTIKAGVTNGMKIPGITQLGNGFLYNTDTAAYYGNPDLQAEKSWNYELSTIFDVDPGFFTLTAFYTDFKDKVYTQTYSNSGTGSADMLPNGETCTYGTCYWYTNVDKALTRGIEAAFEMNPIAGIGFNVNYTFTDSKQLSGAQMGLPVNYIAKHTLNAKLSYKLNNFFDTYLRIQGKFKTPINQTSNSGQPPAARALFGTYYKDYAVVDLGFNFHLRQDLTLSAVVNNLFDVNFADITAVGTNYSNLYGVYLPGRNYWISLRYGF